jgi:hypothetical protein
MGTAPGSITDDEAQSIVRTLLPGVPVRQLPGAQRPHQRHPPPGRQDYNESGAEPYWLRSPGQLKALFLEDLGILKPGLVSCPRRRPGILAALAPGRTLDPARLSEEVDQFCASARKP